MQDRVIAGLVGVLRMVLVIAAVIVAVVPIGLSAVGSFCPDDPGAGTETAAGLGPTLLATVEAPTDDVSDPTAPSTDPLAPPSDPVSPSPTETPDTIPPDEQVVCGEGVSQCFPPLISSVVQLGSSTCLDEAGERLRSRLVPAALVSTAMMGGAWLLRPRTGGALVSRY